MPKMGLTSILEYRCTCCILILFLQLYAVTGSEEYGCASYILHDQFEFCFDVYDGTKTKSECSNLCAEKKSGLPIVTSEAVNQALRELVQEYLLLDIWLGVEEILSAWHWHDDGTAVDSQGCYHDDETAFVVSTQLADLTRGRCENLCSGFRYYAMRNGDECCCSNSLGTYDLIDQCNIACSGNSSVYCGGEFYKETFATAGTFSFWDSGQPNNHYNYQSCGLVDYEGRLYWNDASCPESHGAICQFELSEADCIARNYTYLDGTCFWSSTTQNTWYYWSYTCHTLGGYLLHVASEAQWTAILEHLQETVWDTSLWMGLVNREWHWLSGERLLYSNWASSRPNGADQECVIMGDDGRWDDVLCSLKYSCVCQRDNVTRPTIPPTTTPVTTVPITSPATTLEPTTPAPTEPSLFDLYIRWALLAISILLVTIIIAVVAFCICVRRDKQKEAMAQSDNFNLFYGLDVGDRTRAANHDRDVNFVYPDTPKSVHHNHAAETNGTVISPSNGSSAYENFQDVH